MLGRFRGRGVLCEEVGLDLERAPANVVSDAGYFSLDDIDKVPEGVDVIMPGRKQAQQENKSKTVWYRRISLR